jgi:phosphatidate phosphatase APP1
VSERRRLHVGARAEDAVHRVTTRWLRSRGWIPLVTASTGYADADGVHVFVRALLAPAKPVDRETQPRRRLRRAAAQPARPPRGWRSLISVPAAGTAVTIAIGGEHHTLTSARGGYVHAELPVVLAPGWHDVTVAVEGREPVSCRVRAADPRATHGVISDIDDTVVVTLVPRPLLAAWNTFVLREHARRPVPGMAELLSALAAGDGFVVYLSTGAWNFAPPLERFLSQHGLPPGPLLLTDWGPTDTGWFRSGASHKREMLERLHREHPAVRWTLVGDDGQHDPEIYDAFATAHPAAVEAIAIRRLSAAQQILVSGTPTASSPSTPSTPSGSSLRGPHGGVPWSTGADGHELMRALVANGVIPRQPDTR